MTRQALDSGQWFNLDKARSHGKARAHNGKYFVNEEIFLTESGRWVFHQWPAWPRRHKWEEINPEQVAQWCIKSGKEVPTGTEDPMDDIVASLEV